MSARVDRRELELAHHPAAGDSRRCDRCRRAVSVLVVAAALSLAGASTATATRYAAPAGSDTSPTCAPTAPCSLARAVAVAASGEEIVVLQGEYRVRAPAVPCTGPFDPAGSAAIGIGDRYIHGQPGRPRPRLIGDAGSCVLLNVGGAGRASHLEVIGSNTTAKEAAAVLIDGNGSADDLVTGGANGTIHMRNGARLLDSVAGARPQDGAAIFAHFGYGTGASFITNVTALGDVVADSVPISPSSQPVAVEIACVNSIATGRFLARLTNANPGSFAHVNRDHCAGVTATSGANTATPDVGGSIPGATLVPGDYHQTPTSPTINGGRLHPTFTYPDIDGGSRYVGADPDIGADEFGSASAMVDSGAVQGVSGASAVVAGTVWPGGVATNAYVEYGPTTGYGSQTPPVAAGGAFAATAVSFSLTGMSTNVPAYHYRLAATNGGATGEDRTIAFADADADGWFSNADCDDGNAGVHPQRDDVPDDGVDADCSGADSVNLDRDADGYARPLDCDDANPAVNPGARDVPGNRLDEDCRNGAAPYPMLTSTIGYSVRAFARFTVFTDLFVRHARRGSSITVRCAGRGCRFKTSRRAVKRDRAKLSLRALVTGLRLRPGDRLRISMTLPETVGIDTTLTVRGHRRTPLRRDACLPPGASRATRCRG